MLPNSDSDPGKRSKMEDRLAKLVLLADATIAGRAVIFATLLFHMKYETLVLFWESLSRYPWQLSDF
jgi:hypothetical protein